MNEGLKINNYDKFNNKYKITDINNFKIASTYENMTNLLFGFDVMAQALTVGLFGSTKSLLSYSSNKDEIIQTLQSMELLLFSRPEIERFLTKDGFDYSGFLNYGMITGKFTDKDLAALDNYVYVRELKSNLDEILHNFLSALTGIALFIKDKGIKSLNLTSYYLISFLVRYICKDVHYRVAYKNILCQLSEYIAAIDTLVMDSKKQDTVSYKGVNIETYGDDIDSLANGIHKVMQAIDKLPSPLLKQFSMTKGIVVSDLESPSNITFLMNKKEHREDPKILNFRSTGAYSPLDDKIIFYHVNTRGVKELFETLCHELGHALDYRLFGKNADFTSLAPIWKEAKEADNRSVTAYGDKYLCEDFAEACKYYSLGYAEEIDLFNFCMKYPNRSRVLAALFDIRSYDPSNPNSISPERKFGIAAMFENTPINVLDIFISKEEEQAAYQMTPPDKINYAQHMVKNGVPLQFTSKYINEQFLVGFNADDLMRLFNIYREAGCDREAKILFSIGTYASKTGLLNEDKVAKSIYGVVPVSLGDKIFLEDLFRFTGHNPGKSSLAEIVSTCGENISPDLYEQLINCFFSGFERSM